MAGKVVARRAIAGKRTEHALADCFRFTEHVAMLRLEKAGQHPRGFPASAAPRRSPLRLTFAARMLACTERQRAIAPVLGDARVPLFF